MAGGAILLNPSFAGFGGTPSLWEFRTGQQTASGGLPGQTLSATPIPFDVNAADSGGVKSSHLAIYSDAISWL